jgi:predicted dehydrogenase
MLRFGLLGTGYWAAETQAAGLSGHPDAELVGVWGRDPAKAGTLAKRYGVRGFADVDALIADVDANAVALPPDVQADLATRAARAGRHLLLDKPVALRVEAADALVAAVDANGLATLVFTTNRYRPEVDAFLREAVATGGWFGARTTLYAANFQPGSPYADSPWRYEKGGAVALPTDAVSAFRAAVSRLAANVAAGVTRDVLDVHAGRDAVAVLAAADRAAAEGMTVRL